MRATLDSLQEFRVTTSNYDASAGRSSGAQVNLVTKSGTNAFHGSLYEYHRPNYTVANDWFNKQAELNAGLPNVPGFVLRNTFGGTVGGPIKKDRLFFFAAYEGQRTARSAADHTHHSDAKVWRRDNLKYLCNPDGDANCVNGNNSPWKFFRCQRSNLCAGSCDDALPRRYYLARSGLLRKRSLSPNPRKSSGARAERQYRKSWRSQSGCPLCQIPSAEFDERRR